MQPDQNSSVQPDYGFIMNAQKPKRFNLNVGGGSPLVKRLVIVGGSFVVLLIVFIVFKNILTTSAFNNTDYLSVLEDQTEMLHIVNNDIQTQNQNATISSANQAFSQTVILTMGSYQANLIKYMRENGVKVNSSELTGKQSSLIDSEFSSAQTSNNFNSIFQNVMSEQLVTYNADLIRAYSSTGGPVGRNLLQSQYKGTQLLIRELNRQYS